MELLQWDQNQIIAYQNSKEVQTCFNVSKQKDEQILLLVYCPSISSNFVCSEFRVKKKEQTKKQQKK